MKNKVALRLLTFILAVLLPAAALSGCGGGTAEPAAEPTAEELVVDSFLRGIVDGDPAALLNALPPARLAQVQADMPRATREELGGVFLNALRCEFPYTDIREISYRTERIDDSSADVYYWGVFEQTDASGTARTVTVGEGDARSFNVVTVDGACYLNV